MKFLLVSTTTNSQTEAQKIAHEILQAKLAACVQIVPGIESHYWWKNKLESATEFLLLIKSSEDHFEALAAFIKKNHSYECPEIVALAADQVEGNYANWWREQLYPLK